MWQVTRLTLPIHDSECDLGIMKVKELMEAVVNFRVESGTIHNTYYTHNTHMLVLNYFQIHNTCYTHIFFYVYTCVHNFSKLNYFGAFFQVLRMFFMLS